MHKNQMRQLLLIVLVGAFTACSKDNDAIPGGEETPTSDTMFNRVISVMNFGEDLPEGSQPLDSQSPIYYSLETNKPAQQSYVKTARWDISLSDIYRSFMGGNNGDDTRNLGHTGPGKGGIMILAKSFEEVVDVPADGQFKTASAIIGTDEAGDFGAGIGYYLYDFDGIRVADGSPNYQHIAYALADTLLLKNGTKIPPRTIIVRTAHGNYAKVKVMSIYKDLLNPKDWRKNSPHPFFSFQYVMVKAGSTKFEIK